MTPYNAETEHVFHLDQLGGADSSRITINSSDESSWSHITVQKTKAAGTNLSLYSGSSSKPVAVAREQKISDRPGVAESTQAIAGAFEIVDEQGEPLAKMRKNALRSVLRTTWEIEFVDGSQATGRETNPLKIAFRRLLMLAQLIIDFPVHLSSGFAFRSSGEKLFAIETVPKSDGAMTLSVAPGADERIALLQAALTQKR